MDQVLITAIVTIITGIILLTIEHKTGWFERQLRTPHQTEVITTTLLDFNISKFKWILGTIIIVFPITAIIVTQIMGAEIRLLKAKVQAYEQSEQWGLPETLQGLKEVSEEIKISMNERELITQQSNLIRDLNDELALTKKELDQAKTVHESLQNENTVLKVEVDNMKKQLIPTGDEFILKEGQSFELIKNSTRIGVRSLLSSFVNTQVGNNYIDLHAGESTTVTAAGVECTIYLTEIMYTESTAKYSYICK